MAITTTSRALIERSLRMLGVLQSGESADTSTAADCLAVLNAWIDATQLHAYMSLVQQRTVYDLVANQQSYTIGPSALTPDFSTGTQPRPSVINAAGLVLNSASPAVEIPLGILTEQAYQALGIKDYTNPQPVVCYYEPTMPTGSVFLWPEPTTSLNDLALYTPLVTAQFADLTSSVTLPPGYARMFHYNLAVELYPEFPKASGLAAEVRQTAIDSLGDVKRMNVPMSDLGMDPGLVPNDRPSYNIWSDQG